MSGVPFQEPVLSMGTWSSATPSQGSLNTVSTVCPQLGEGIEIAQLSYYSRGKTPPLCLPVCRRLQLVSFDDGILVVEWIQSTAL